MDFETSILIGLLMGWMRPDLYYLALQSADIGGAGDPEEWGDGTRAQWGDDTDADWGH